MTHATNFEFSPVTIKVDRLTERVECFEKVRRIKVKSRRFADSRNHESVLSLRRVRRNARGYRHVRAQQSDQVAGNDLQVLSTRRGTAAIGRRFEQCITALRVDVERVEAVDLLAEATDFRRDSARRVARRRWPKTGMRRSFGIDPRALPESQPVHPARQRERRTRDQQQQLLSRQPLLRRFERAACVHAEEIDEQSCRRDDEAASTTMLRRQRHFPRTRVSLVNFVSSLTVDDVK